MKYTACVDRLEEGILVFLCDNGTVYTAPHSVCPDIREGERCILTVEGKEITAVSKAPEQETKEETAQLQKKLHKLFFRSH